MPTVIGTSSAGAGIRYDLGTTSSLFVLPGSYVVSSDSDAVVSTGSNQTVTVAGSVYGDSRGVYLGGDLGLDFSQSLRILAGGSVSSPQSGSAAAVRIDASYSDVYNAGSISGGYGILIGSVIASGTSTITNFGSIAGDVYGIRHLGLSVDALRVINFGTISGLTPDTLSFSSNSGDIAVDTIVNRGVMLGGINTGGGEDIVDNRGGRIEGDVNFSFGNDRYVGTGGGVVIGAVYGDDGADTFFGNENAADVFVGGDGVDTLDFRLGGQVTLALDLSFAQSGAALGDTYFEMENVFGSDIGNDVIRGNGFGNALFGWGGNDSLDGASGNDVLRGGTGVDTLTGGIGNDTFRFSALNECGDLITDFGNVITSDDRFQITAAAFGGGLVAGALAANQFQTRADNIAQDADDRFIFNTTDRTLWFDADGNGAGAAVMVADLQAGAVVTAADILLI